MKEPIKIIDLSTEQDFQNTINLKSAIIYFNVSWSAQERISRAVVYRAIDQLEKTSIHIFQIDPSDERKQYVINWIFQQKESTPNFKYGGYGEMILVSKGSIIDFINYPGIVGIEKVKEKINEWMSGK